MIDIEGSVAIVLHVPIRGQCEYEYLWAKKEWQFSCEWRGLRGLLWPFILFLRRVSAEQFRVHRKVNPDGLAEYELEAHWG